MAIAELVVFVISYLVGRWLGHVANGFEAIVDVFR